MNESRYMCNLRLSQRWLRTGLFCVYITPYIPSKVNRRFGGIFRLYLQGRRTDLLSSISHTCFLHNPKFRQDDCTACNLLSTLVSCLASSSTSKMEFICPSKKSFDFQLTRRRYISEGRISGVNFYFLIYTV